MAEGRQRQQQRRHQPRRASTDGINVNIPEEEEDVMATRRGTPQSSASSHQDHGDKPSDKPDEYSGTMEEYQSWRRKTALWLLDTKCPTHKKGIRILRSLTGSAWRTCEHLVENPVLGQDGGEQLVFAELDKFYRYEPQSDIQKRFEDVISMPYKGSRDGQQFIGDAVYRFTRLDEALQGALKSQPLPGELKSYLLIKKYGLREGEIAQLLAATGLSWDFHKVVQALKAQFLNHQSRDRSNTELAWKGESLWETS